MHTEVQTEKPVEKYLERPKGWTDKKTSGVKKESSQRGERWEEKTQKDNRRRSI